MEMRIEEHAKLYPLVSLKGHRKSKEKERRGKESKKKTVA